MDRQAKHVPHIQKQIDSLQADVPYGANLRVEFVGGQFYIWRTRLKVDDVEREIPIVRGRYAVARAFVDGVKFGARWSRDYDGRISNGNGSGSSTENPRVGA